ncbi:amino acid ABC transporter permease [Arthrobacter ginkgonis]|uniref:Amino acid ABC transporter permease n=1 Tax=Arthrobacter ginkgonis TaxID=1630594 RepID=A0ABP7CX34_9MICC
MSAEILLRSLGFTLLVTGASFAVAAVLGLFVVAARRSGNRILRGAATLWITVMRGVPPLVWLFVVFFGITIQGARLTPVSAAIVTLGAVGSAYLGEAYRAGLESVPASQREALSALSVPRWASLRLVILPQALPIMVSAGAAFGIHLLKDTALASLIGVQEMTYLTNDAVQRGADGFVAFFLLGLAYLALSAPVGMLARSIEQRVQRNRMAVA